MLEFDKRIQAGADAFIDQISSGLQLASSLLFPKVMKLNWSFFKKMKSCYQLMLSMMI